MGEWVDTPYGKRYKEDHSSCIAFFMTESNEEGKRVLPAEVIKIYMEARIEEENDSG